MACAAGLAVSTEPELKSFSVNRVASTLAMASSRASTAASRGVVVGEVRFSVSDTRPASSNPAIASGSSTPVWKKQSATMVLVEPTGSLRNKMG